MMTPAAVTEFTLNEIDLCLYATNSRLMII